MRFDAYSETQIQGHKIQPQSHPSLSTLSRITKPLSILQQKRRGKSRIHTVGDTMLFLPKIRLVSMSLLSNSSNLDYNRLLNGKLILDKRSFDESLFQKNPQRAKNFSKAKSKEASSADAVILGPGKFNPDCRHLTRHWWRRRESNPRPEMLPQEHLRV